MPAASIGIYEAPGGNAIQLVDNIKALLKNTDWGVLLLFGGGITLSSILVQTGAAGFLADQVSSLAMGHSPCLLYTSRCV